MIAFSGDERFTFLTPVPTSMAQDFTKKKQNVTRIQFNVLRSFLSNFPGAQVVMERPMINPTRYKATLSAVRCIEATLCVLESLDLPEHIIDDRVWKKGLFPAGVKGPAANKQMSTTLGCKRFPELKKQIKMQGDADAMFIADYCRKEYQ